MKYEFITPVFCLTVNHVLPIHESVAIGGSTVRKQEGDLKKKKQEIFDNPYISYLVSGHGHKGDEVPEHVGVLEMGHLQRDCIDDHGGQHEAAEIKSWQGEQ